MVERCDFCAEPGFGTVCVKDSLRTLSYCGDHIETATREAERLYARFNKPCSKCGAPAPFYHHNPECPYLVGRLQSGPVKHSTRVVSKEPQPTEVEKVVEKIEEQQVTCEVEETDYDQMVDVTTESALAEVKSPYDLNEEIARLSKETDRLEELLTRRNRTAIENSVNELLVDRDRCRVALTEAMIMAGLDSSFRFTAVSSIPVEDEHVQDR